MQVEAKVDDVGRDRFRPLQKRSLRWMGSRQQSSGFIVEVEGVLGRIGRVSDASDWKDG